MGRNRCESAGKMSRLTVDTGRRSISRLDIIQLLLLPYLDPGSGSFLIQILIAAVLGGILSGKAVDRSNSGSVSTVVKSEPDRKQPGGSGFGRGRSR